MKNPTPEVYEQEIEEYVKENNEFKFELKSENIQDRLNIPVIIEASYDTDGDNQGFRK